MSTIISTKPVLARFTIILGLLMIYMPLLYAQESGGIPAFLPMADDVAETEALPIDGVWKISTIQKQIRIERGRAYAVEPWLHMFVLQVKTGMVVMRNFERSSAGQYIADDLPLLGQSHLQLNNTGDNMLVNVKSVLGPISYELQLVEADDPQSLADEVVALNGEEPVATPPVSPGEDTDSPQDLTQCLKVGIDPNTGELACFD